MGIVPRKFFCEECKKMRWPGDCGHGRIVSQLKSLSADELTMMVSDRRRCGCDTRAGTVCSCRGPKEKTTLKPVAAHLLEGALDHYITTGGKRLYHDETRPGWVISAHFAVYVGEEAANSALTKERRLLRVVARATTTQAMNDLDRYGRGEMMGWNNVMVSGDDGPVEMVGFRTWEEKRRCVQCPTILAKPYAALLTGKRVCRAHDGDLLGPVSGWDYDKLVAVVMPRRGETIV
jgi:hypothetical protein